MTGFPYFPYSSAPLCIHVPIIPYKQLEVNKLYVKFRNLKRFKKQEKGIGHMSNTFPCFGDDTTNMYNSYICKNYAFLAFFLISIATAPTMIRPLMILLKLSFTPISTRPLLMTPGSGYRRGLLSRGRYLPYGMSRRRLPPRSHPARSSNRSLQGPQIPHGLPAGFRRGAAQAPHHTYVSTRFLSTLIPATRAAWSFPPIAYKLFPKRVWPG